MTDLWIDIIFAILVTLATFGADLIANRLVTSTRRLAAIKQVAEKTISDRSKLNEINKEIERYLSDNRKGFIWGSELASIALSMDLAILGVWALNPTFFPFFARWNTDGVSREIPIWFILLFSHFLFLLISISLKQYHSDTCESLPNRQAAKFMKRNWVSQNKYMLLSNTVGFISLLSSFVIITNAI
jgi:hypothetical protein